jgi:hypothetical protein
MCLCGITPEGKVVFGRRGVHLSRHHDSSGGYDNARLIYIKEKLLLDKLILPVKDQLDQDVREAIFADRRVPLALLAIARVQAVLTTSAATSCVRPKKVQILLNIRCLYRSAPAPAPSARHPAAGTPNRRTSAGTRSRTFCWPAAG